MNRKPLNFVWNTPFNVPKADISVISGVQFILRMFGEAKR